jgi:hypothetical protein
MMINEQILDFIAMISIALGVFVAIYNFPSFAKWNNKRKLRKYKARLAIAKAKLASYTLSGYSNPYHAGEIAKYEFLIQDLENT